MWQESAAWTVKISTKGRLFSLPDLRKLSGPFNPIERFIEGNLLLPHPPNQSYHISHNAIGFVGFPMVTEFWKIRKDLKQKSKTGFPLIYKA